MTDDRTPENMDGILRRVQKLLAIVEDGRGSPEEAAAAASMAANIMRKYQLDHADVIMAGLKRGEDMTSADVVATAKTNGTRVARVPTWAQWIAVSVGKVNEVHVSMRTTTSGDVGIRFSGFSSDVQVASWTFDYLVATVNRLGEKFRKTDAYRIGGRPAANSYRAGLATGITKMLLAALQAQPVQSSGRELMIVKAAAVAERFGQQRTKQSNSTVRNGAAYAQGFADGKAVDVNRRGVGHTAASAAVRIGG